MSARGGRSSARAEGAVVALLAGSAVAAIAFSVVYVTGADTQFLGLALGGALLLLAAAAVVAGKRLVSSELATEDRPALADPETEAEVDRLLRERAAGLSRRGLIAAGGAAGAGLLGALLVPAASLGPDAVSGTIESTPWRRGRRLVDERGRTLSADVLEVGGFLTAYPEGADRRELGSPIVVVRLSPGELDLPQRRRGWAPEGHVAFSKVCTHAGCAVGLFRSPLYEPTSRPPALVCPCHYSTFDVRRAAKVVFGPAGRPLPQLPLAIDSERNLVAAGGFSGPIGPAWWSVRRT